MFNIIAALVIIIVTIYTALKLLAPTEAEDAEKAKLLPLEKTANNKEGATKIHVEKSSPSLGIPPPSQQTIAHSWPDRPTLIRQALDYFTKNQNWSACLYLSTISPKESIERTDQFKFAAGFYERTINDIISSEAKALGVSAPADRESRKKFLDALSSEQTIVLLNNVRHKLGELSLPPQVSTILLRVFSEELQDEFITTIARSAVGKKTERIIPYSEAKEFADLFLGPDVTRHYLATHLRNCLNAQYSSWRSLNKKNKRWLIQSLGRSARDDSLSSLLQAHPETIDYETYLSLSSHHRHLLASTTLSKLDKRAFDKYLKGSMLWKTLKEDMKMDARLIDAIRRHPDWLRALSEPDYSKAIEEARDAYRRLTGSELPEKTEKKLKADLQTESEMWNMLTAPDIWKNIARQTRVRGESAEKNYWRALFKLFPNEAQNSAQKELIRQCMINRGLDPSIFGGKL